MGTDGMGFVLRWDDVPMQRNCRARDRRPVEEKRQVDDEPEKGETGRRR